MGICQWWVCLIVCRVEATNLSARSAVQILMGAETDMPYYQNPVDHIIEQSQILQACGYVAITVILQLWVTL